MVKNDAKIKADFGAKSVNTVDFAKKLLGQIVFLYFLQKKGWFGVGRDAAWGIGPKNFLRLLYEKNMADYKNFFNDILEPLFYEALAIERTNDFYSRFNCKIPFLNGGLFDPINSYDWVHTDILMPNELFSNEEKTKEGDIGTGIFDVFDRYNFTVREDEPLEKEVAIDPEMLGKVFENLLEVKDRKSKGTYYTPREIVHYMCQESLINYLDVTINPQKPAVREPAFTPNMPIQKKLFGETEPRQLCLTSEKYQPVVPLEDIESFIRHGDIAIEHDVTAKGKHAEKSDYNGKYKKYKLPETIRTHAKLIDDALADIKICDPAIGSGAFPVGMMHEIVRARQTLATYLRNTEEGTLYNFKRHAIQESLYGVDIDLSAVEIAKLRLWLSLVVDEDDYQTIKPLPNLDYKIICGNSLLEVKIDLSNSHLFEEMEKLKPLYFDETNLKKKKEMKQKIDDLIHKITENKELFDFEIYFSEIFHKKGGFDVAIGNPPYGLLNKRQNKTQGHIARNEEIELYKSLSEFAPAMGGMVNVFRLFIIRSINVLNMNGFFTQIFPLAFVGDVSAAKLRKYILDNHSILSIEAFPERDNEKKRVFEGVKMSVCILNLCKSKNKQNEFFLRIHKDKFVNTDNEQVKLDMNIIKSIDGINFTIPLLYKKELNIICKIYSKSEGFKKFGHCYTGEIDLTFHKKHISDDPRKSFLIKGAMIGKYLIKKEMSQGEIKYLDSLKYLKENCGAKTKHHQAERIVMQAITGVNEKTRLKMTLADKGIYCANSVNYIVLDYKEITKYILALLNSSVLNFVFSKTSTNSNVNGYEIDNLPIVIVNNEEQKLFVKLVDKILSITKDEGYLLSPDKQAKVHDLEKQIDQLGYKLYGLTEEEIKIVEDSSKR